MAFRDLPGQTAEIELLLAKRRDDQSALVARFIEIAHAIVARTAV